MLDLFIGFVVGCAIGYAAREMLSRYRRDRVRRERVEQRYSAPAGATFCDGGGRWAALFISARTLGSVLAVGIIEIESRAGVRASTSVPEQAGPCSTL